MALALNPQATTVMSETRIARLEAAELKFHDIQEAIARGELEDEELDKLLQDLRVTLRLIAELYASNESGRKP